MTLNPVKVETKLKRFKFEDNGGTAVRGKVRIEKVKEDRKF
jgi:hypothetical protein